MSAETIQLPTDGLPPPSPEEKAAHAESRVWTIGGIVAAVIMAFLTAWLAYAVWQKDNAAKDLTLKRYEVSIAAAVKASRELEKSNLELRGKVATLESNATKSASEVATLQKAATDAKATQQQVEIELNKQRERTANTELRLEVERKDRLELEKSLAPRIIAFIQDQTGRNVAPLEPFAGTSFVVEVVSDIEARRAAGMLIGVLESAKWAPRGGVINEDLAGSITERGVLVLYPRATSADRDTGGAVLSNKMKLRDAARALEEFLKSSGWDAMARMSWDNDPNDALKIQVNLKPAPRLVPPMFRTPF